MHGKFHLFISNGRKDWKAAGKTFSNGWKNEGHSSLVAKDSQQLVTTSPFESALLHLFERVKHPGQNITFHHFVR